MSAEHDPRIDAILEVLLAFARQDFSRKAPISDKLDAVDALAAGLNMLAEELDGAVASRRELEQAYRSQQEAQARLVHRGKLVAIGQLASGVAHEINNPATWVTLSLTLFSRHLTELREVVRGNLSPERQALVERLLADSERALCDAADGMAQIRAVTGDLGQEIIQRYRGSVHLDDSDLGGARFTVCPPAAVAPEGSAAPSAPECAAKTACRKRLLIVDDEARLLQTYALLLAPHHDVCLADGGRAALARLETDRAFDLIVCDLQMPDLDGVDVYERLLLLDPALARRIVFSTGGAFQSRAREFLARVAPPVLQKPVRAEELLAHISRATA